MTRVRTPTKRRKPAQIVNSGADHANSLLRKAGRAILRGGGRSSLMTGIVALVIASPGVAANHSFLSACINWPQGCVAGVPATLPVLELVPCNDPTIQDCGNPPNNHKENPEIGVLLECTDARGDQSLFRVIDATGGTNYNVWVLKQIAGSDVRVGWNNQLPQTKSGLQLEYVNTFWEGAVEVSDRGSLNAVEQDLTGACGGFVKDTHGTMADPARIDIKIHFTGLNYQLTDTHGEVRSVGFFIRLTRMWTVVVNLADSSKSMSVEFGLNGSLQWSSESSITVTTVEKNFSQDYTIQPTP